MMQDETAIERKDTAIAKTPTVLDVINKLSASPSLSLEAAQAIKELVQLQREQDTQARKERFFEALRVCQSEMPRVRKNGLIDPRGAAIPYAKLEDLDACIRPIYQKHGFSVYFDAPSTVDGKIRNVGHFSCAGHKETLEITASASNRSSGRLQMTEVQKVKQTITECRRHLQEMFFNIITEDGDAPAEEEVIDQGQADDIRTRMNDLPQSKPGNLLAKLCAKYGVSRPEDFTVSQYAAVCADVEATEKAKKV
jgi:hypothetical protein